VDAMGRLVSHEHAGEDLGHIVEVDRADHRVLEGQGNGMATGGLGDAPYVIDRPAHLVRPRDIGTADSGDAHAILFRIIQRLPFVHDLVLGVLIFAVHGIVFGHGTVAVVGLLAVRGEGTGIHYVRDP